MKMEARHIVITVLLVICIVMLGMNLFAPKKQAAEKPAETDSKNVETAGNPTLETIMQRKSVRSYTDRPVTRQQLMRILRAGMAAPTAGNRQPWAFVVVTDRKTLDSLANELPYAKMLKEAPAAIVVCGVPKWGLKGKAAVYWVQDCSAVSENILLAVESMNLGAVWTGVYPIEERIKTVREILRIPGDVIPLNVIAIGRPKGNPKPKNKWKPDRIHWGKW